MADERKSGGSTWIILIVVVAVLALVLLCACGGFLLFGMAGYRQWKLESEIHRAEDGPRLRLTPPDQPREAFPTLPPDLKPAPLDPPMSPTEPTP